MVQARSKAEGKIDLKKMESGKANAERQERGRWRTKVKVKNLLEFDLTLKWEEIQR